MHRGLVAGRARLVQILGRFALLVLVALGAAWKLPALARLLLDPFQPMSDQAPFLYDAATRAATLRMAWGWPVGLLLVAAALAIGQRSFAFQGRRLALRKQAWALYGEFLPDIEARLAEGEEPVGYRMADPPELATSLLLRLGLLWLFLSLVLLAVITPLALRVHWPERGQQVWYLLGGALTAAGLLVLARVRTPPVLRLFIQSAVPALHFGHALMLGASPLTPLGVPAAPLDLALGVLSGVLAYRLGQRERGGMLLVFTTRGLLAFDPAGRHTRELGAVRPLARIHVEASPAGARADFLDPRDAGLRGVAFEGFDSLEEMPELLATRGVTVTLTRGETRSGAWAALRQPGLLGWALLLGLALLVGRQGAELLDSQALLKAELLRHLPAWYRGDPRPLLAGATRCLQLRPGFRPAQVMEALAHFDLGEWDAASAGLRALAPEGDELHGFAARVLPARRGAVGDLYRLAMEVPDPAALAAAEAEYLLGRVGGPHAARLALQRLEAAPGTAPLAEGVARLLLVGAPEARWPFPRQDAADLRAEAAARVPALEDAARAFLEASVRLQEGARAAALDAARDHGALAGLLGDRGPELARTLAVAFLEVAPGDPARAGQGRDFLAAALAATPPAHRVHLDLELAAAALAGEPAASVQALRVAHPEHFSLLRVLAEEAAGEAAWAEYAAFQLVGLELARGASPDACAPLGALGSAHRHYLAALAWTALAAPDRARAAYDRAQADPSFGWSAWAARRGVTR